jgi:hypothetical protein
LPLSGIGNHFFLSQEKKNQQKHFLNFFCSRRTVNPLKKKTLSGNYTLVLILICGGDIKFDLPLFCSISEKD